MLSSSCWIERLEPATEDPSDMTKMRFTAWTDDPGRFLRRKTLLIAEHEQWITYDDPDMQLIFGSLPPYLHQKKVLSYKALIHLRRVADFRPRSPSPSLGPSLPSSDGDSSHDRNPDRGYGKSWGVGPQLHGFFTQDGVEDRSGGTPARGASSGVRLLCAMSEPPPVKPTPAPQASMMPTGCAASTPATEPPSTLPLSGDHLRRPRWRRRHPKLQQWWTGTGQTSLPQKQKVARSCCP